MSGKHIAQRIRTRKNQIKRYEKLIAEKPHDKHVSIWKQKLENMK